MIPDPALTEELRAIDDALADLFADTEPHERDCDCDLCEASRDDAAADQALNWQRENGNGDSV